MFPIDGVDRCACGSKYWASNGQCIDCGETYSVDPPSRFHTVEFQQYKEFEPVGIPWVSQRKYARIGKASAPDLWADEESGLITEDPRKFEAWLDKLGKKE